MKVIFGKQAAESLGNRMTVLELDTFFQVGLSEPITAYAVIDTEAIPLQEIPTMSNFVELHNNMMSEYRKQNWNYCEQAIEHLLGKWKGDLDTFYTDLESRIKQLKETNLSKDWQGIIINTAT